MEKNENGTVYLVGAGPGAAGLMTVRGSELLRRADVVIYDALINRNLLSQTREGAELIFAGKRGGTHSVPQDNINQLLVKHAREGRMVVRLKGGDPFIFGRGGEEIAELKKAGIPFEVVPGVSAFHAVPAYAGIPITHRDHSSGFVVITGYEDPGKPAPAVDWSAVANAPGTKIVFMGVKQIGPITESLMQHGMPGTVPVAVIRWGTRGGQETLVGTLSDIADKVESTGFKPPAMIVIGDVVQLRDRLGWFEKRPLIGQRIVNTRAREQAGELTALLEEQGAEVLELPVIRLVQPDIKQPLADAFQSLHSYNWFVFTSANGVDRFFDYFFKVFDDIRSLGGARIAAVGPATAARLQALHLQVDAMPKSHVAAEVAKAMSDYENLENLMICIPRAEQGSPDLVQALGEFHAIVDDVPVYRTTGETEDRTEASEALMEKGADWIVFTSGSTVKHFNQRHDLVRLQQQFPNLKLASIGPETTRAMRSLNLKPTVEAEPHTIQGITAAITRHALGASGD